MKFLKYLYKNKNFNDNSYFDNLDSSYDFYNYTKLNIKNRKIYSYIRPGVFKTPKQNSIFRDKNNLLSQQFVNLNLKDGKKNLVCKNLNKMLENFFLFLSFYSKEFEIYNNYNSLFINFNSNNLFNHFIDFLKDVVLGLESIFEIKTKKIDKKSKLKQKYSHEIVYIPKERRLKYVLRSLNFYKENFKNYDFWERLFWSLFLILVNKEKSFLKKRRQYIYLKSLKFFKKKATK